MDNKYVLTSSIKRGVLFRNTCFSLNSILYRHLIKTAIFLFLFILSSCNTALYFDQYAYKESISVKVDALALMDKANEDYLKHRDNVEKIKLAMLKIYEYEKYRPNNIESNKMWAIMINPDKHLFFGFLNLWQEKSSLSEVFIRESKNQMEEAFDLIIKFEKKKIK